MNAFDIWTDDQILTNMSADPKKSTKKRIRRSTCIEVAETVEPRVSDVLLYRGRTHTERLANHMYNTAVQENMEDYNSATSRQEKIRITNKIVDLVTRQGRFLAFDKRANGWVELDNKTARLRVSQALRNLRQKLKQESEKADSDSTETAPPTNQERGTNAESSTLEEDTNVQGSMASDVLFTDDELRSVLLPEQYDSKDKERG